MSSQMESSSSTCRWKHDVFLSFRGDVRLTFADHLYNALTTKGINTFRDDEKLKIGKVIRPELLEAIEHSKFAIVLFSKEYASSKWCLDELAKIVECMKERELIVVPVFYHVEPTDVRHQSNPFEQSFADLEKNEGVEKVNTWRAAFKQVGNLAGEHIKGERYETEHISKIVGKISRNLEDILPRVTKGLVGIKSQLKELNRHLWIESNDIRFIGICGMSGMGKTTLAEAAYASLHSKFEGCSFIENIKDISKGSDLYKLQQKLLVDILKEEGISVGCVTDGVSMIQRRLRGLKILLILDDVNDLTN